VKNLFEAASVMEIRNRIERLRPNSQRQWGAMDVAQMMAHCSAWLEMAAGLNSPRRSLIGRIFGRLAKKSVLGEEPIRRNMPTEKSLIRKDARQFPEEQRRLIDWVDNLALIERRWLAILKIR
jgi:hypothetical protein